MILFVEIANKRNFSCLIMNKNERYDYYGMTKNINMKERRLSDTKK